MRRCIEHAAACVRVVGRYLLMRPTGLHAAGHQSARRARSAAHAACGTIGCPAHRTARACAPDTAHTRMCRLWGDVVKWGSSFKVKTAGECCDACLKASNATKSNPLACNGAAAPARPGRWSTRSARAQRACGTGSEARSTPARLHDHALRRPATSQFQCGCGALTRRCARRSTRSAG